MKILHVVHSLDPRSGGPSNSLRALAAAQARLGDSVAILCTDAQSAEPWLDSDAYRQVIRDEPALRGIEVVIAKGMGRARPLRRWRYSPEGAAWLRARLAGDSRPDVVHVHGLFSHLTTSAARFCRELKIPYALRPAGGLNDFSRQQGNRIGKDILFRIFVKRDLERAYFVHATSARERDELLKLIPGSRIEVVPHGVAIPTDEELDSARASFFAAYPQLASSPFVLYLSRIAPKKRLDLVLRAMAREELAGETFTLVVAGSDAGFRAEVERLAGVLGIADRVLFAGFLEGKQKSGAFAAAALFVLTSEDENFGLAAIEAMAHGAPALLTPGVDSHVYTDAAGAGMTVRGDAAEIAAGIRTLLRGDLAAMGARGRKYARENLGWEPIARSLAQLYSAG